jgi:uncharacterized membrane protein YbhN (UPF0104 family)
VKRRLAWIGTWVVATGLFAICARRVEWQRVFDAMAMTRPSWIMLGAIANIAILLWWAAFWQAILPRAEERVSYRRMFEIVASASALMNTVPFGGGHASSLVLLARRGGVSRRGALSVLALDQLGEGMTKALLFLLVAFIAPLPLWMRAGVTTVSVAVGAWFIVLMVASRWARELDLLRSPRRSVGAWTLVIAMKGAEALAIAAVQRGFGIEISVSGTLLVLAAVLLGTMVPVAPGNLGTYEASAFVAYRYLGVGADQALALAIVQHICFMLPSVGAGYLVLSANAFSRDAIASR